MSIREAAAQGDPSAGSWDRVARMEEQIREDTLTQLRQSRMGAEMEARSAAAYCLEFIKSLKENGEDVFSHNESMALLLKLIEK
jgi:hypothetical protein